MRAAFAAPAACEAAEREADDGARVVERVRPVRGTVGALLERDGERCSARGTRCFRGVDVELGVVVAQVSTDDAVHGGRAAHALRNDDCDDLMDVVICIKTHMI